MAVSIIDTLRYARRLKEAGVAPPQAEVMADALADELVPNLVTKADLALSVSQLQASMATLEASMATLEARLTWRLLGGVGIIVGLAVALLKLG